MSRNKRKGDGFMYVAVYWIAIILVATFVTFLIGLNTKADKLIEGKVKVDTTGLPPASVVKEQLERKRELERKQALLNYPVERIESDILKLMEKRFIAGVEHSKKYGELSIVIRLDEELICETVTYPIPYGVYSRYEIANMYWTMYKKFLDSVKEAGYKITSVNVLKHGYDDIRYLTIVPE